MKNEWILIIIKISKNLKGVLRGSDSLTYELNIRFLEVVVLTKFLFWYFGILYIWKVGCLHSLIYNFFQINQVKEFIL
jgi:hypothetical protein